MRVVDRVHEYASLKSSSTEKSYKISFELLAEWKSLTVDSSAFDKFVKSMTQADAVSFVAWLKRRRTPDGGRTSDNTLHNRIAIIRKLFKHLYAINVVKNNAFVDVSDLVPRRQRRQKRPTKLIPTEKISEILNAPDESSKIGIRDRAILALFFGGGLRRSEVMNLNVGDVAVTHDGVPYLILRGTKAGQDQSQSLPQWSYERFYALVLQRIQDGAQANDPLIVFYYEDGRTRERLGDSTLKRIYQRYCAQCGVHGVSPHSARATAATELKSQGVEDRDVAHFLRHTTTIMVAAYDKRYRGPQTNPGRKLNFINN